MKDNSTHITLVVYRSGSMSATKNDAEGGIRTFVDEQKKVDGDCSFLLYQFDTQVDKVFGPGNLQDFPNTYQLVPRGSTALLDAMGMAIVTTGEYLASLSEDQRPAKVIFLTVTDGEENSSHEYTSNRIRELVTEQEIKFNWSFMFIGSSLMAIEQARQFGINSYIGTQSTPAANRALYRNLASQTKGMRTNTQDVFMSASISASGALSSTPNLKKR